jgi:hypothetical protein
MKWYVMSMAFPAHEMIGYVYGIPCTYTNEMIGYVYGIPCTYTNEMIGYVYGITCTWNDRLCLWHSLYIY